MYAADNLLHIETPLLAHDLTKNGLSIKKQLNHTRKGHLHLYLCSDAVI